MPTKRIIAIPPGYPADLLKPMPRKRANRNAPGNLDPDRNEYVRRLRLLGNYYGISEGHGDFLSFLCLNVLSDWVPGFREPRSGRRSDTALQGKRDRLVTAVVNLKMKNLQLRNNSACHFLASATGTSEKEFRGERPETLRKWLRQGLAERKRKNVILAKLLMEMSPANPGEAVHLGLYGTKYPNPVGA